MGLEASKLSIEQYAKADAAKAAEIWTLSEARRGADKEVPVSANTSHERNNIIWTAWAEQVPFAGRLSQKIIERVYRALYVYSQGFHEMLNEVRTDAKNRRVQILYLSSGNFQCAIGAVRR